MYRTGYRWRHLFRGFSLRMLPRIYIYPNCYADCVDVLFWISMQSKLIVIWSQIYC
jgi:hypothetical protein